MLDADADRYNVESSGTLLLDNLVNEESQQSYYVYRDNKFVFDRIKPDYIEIAFDNIRNYPNVKVRFTCRILTADGNTAVVALGNDIVLLTGKTPLGPGNAVVTGRWAGTSEVKKGAQTVNALNFQVTAVSQ